MMLLNFPAAENLSSVATDTTFWCLIEVHVEDKDAHEAVSLLGLHYSNAFKLSLKITDRPCLAN
jgi:hypothetical protein